MELAGDGNISISGASWMILSHQSQKSNQALLTAAWRGAHPHKKLQKRLPEKKALRETAANAVASSGVLCLKMKWMKKAGSWRYKVL
jgi:hypothetical protein